MPKRYALRDDQWERIKELLPGRKSHVGVSARDNRLFAQEADNEYVLIDSPIVKAHQHSAVTKRGA